MDRVDELTQDCFNTVLSLRRLQEDPSRDPERLHRQIRGQIDQLMQRGLQLGFPQPDVQEMAFAIVAFIDEVALRAPSDVSQYWMGAQLQLQYFNENIAGETFFQRLEMLRTQGRIDPLRVYYMCLLLGFQGRYAMSSNEMELQDLISATKYQIAGAMGDPESLSPSAERPAEALAKKERHTKLFLLPVGAAVAAVVLYIVLSATIAGQATDLTEFIDKLLK